MHEHAFLNHPPIFLIREFPILFCCYKQYFGLCPIVLLGPRSRSLEITRSCQLAQGVQLHSLDLDDLKAASCSHQRCMKLHLNHTGAGGVSPFCFPFSFLFHFFKFLTREILFKDFTLLLCLHLFVLLSVNFPFLYWFFYVSPGNCLLWSYFFQEVLLSSLLLLRCPFTKDINPLSMVPHDSSWFAVCQWASLNDLKPSFPFICNIWYQQIKKKLQIIRDGVTKVSWQLWKRSFPILYTNYC